MANFLDQVGGFVKDLGNNISGKQSQDNLNKQLEAQKTYNQSLFNLEQEKIKLQTSPEYLAQQRNKYILVGSLFAVIMVFVYLVMIKTK